MIIRTKEEQIRKLLKHDEQAKQAFEKMLNYYQMYDLLNYTSHVRLLKAIYLDNKQRYVWQLENIANIGRSTCYVYRNRYIECFYLCLNM